MKKYLLLRDNKETGPYSMDDFSSMGLYSTDLVWLEDQSTVWLYATEIPALQPFLKKRERPVRRVYVSRPVAEPANEGFIPPAHPLTELKERQIPEKQTKTIFRKPSLVLTDALRVAAVFTGLVVGAVMIKKLVDEAGTGPVADNVPAATAIVIDEPPAADETYKNALVTETVPSTQLVKEVKKEKPKDIRKQLRLQGSKYNVGMLGGISNLALSVYNSSNHSVDHVTVEVQYLKPDGSVIHADQYEISSIRPMGVKTLEVPDSRRGVKVTYRIVGVTSKDYKKAVKQI